mmetsp:Transcript_34862/g.80623  ORF Transcript_34862/g.80623 Transcript_34862/m.80623 type:complete len:177 (-) Transcript_34862:61-591(-)
MRLRGHVNILFRSFVCQAEKRARTPFALASTLYVNLISSMSEVVSDYSSHTSECSVSKRPDSDGLSPPKDYYWSTTEIECPLFVTWEKIQKRGKVPPPSSGLRSLGSSLFGEGGSRLQKEETRYELRGCIGTLSPQRLTEALKDYAITSALHDRRFKPISERELLDLRVSVSLLVS